MASDSEDDQYEFFESTNQMNEMDIDRPGSRHSRYATLGEFATPNDQELAVSETIQVYVDPQTGRLVSSDARYNEEEEEEVAMAGLSRRYTQEEESRSNFEDLMESFLHIQRMHTDMQNSLVPSSSADLEDESVLGSTAGHNQHLDRAELTSFISNITNSLAQLVGAAEATRTEASRRLGMITPQHADPVNTPHILSNVGTPPHPHFSSPPPQSPGDDGINRIDFSQSSRVTFQNAASATVGHEELQPLIHHTGEMDEYRREMENEIMMDERTVSSAPPLDEDLESYYESMRDNVESLSSQFRHRVGSISNFHNRTTRNYSNSTSALPNLNPNGESIRAMSSSNAQRWRRLISSRRQMFERMWRQEIDFWRRVEEQLEHRWLDGAVPRRAPDAFPEMLEDDWEEDDFDISMMKTMDSNGNEINGKEMPGSTWNGREHVYDDSKAITPVWSVGR